MNESGCCKDVCTMNELEFLRASAIKMNGPFCENGDCLDFDGAHPFHFNAVERAFREGQDKLRPLLAEAEENAKFWQDAAGFWKEAHRKVKHALDITEEDRDDARDMLDVIVEITDKKSGESVIEAVQRLRDAADL